jgi:glutamyl-tRNA(Gln) amidotransferase subunit E
MEIDWNNIGLKVGLEIHQQLNTKMKLFCNCSTQLSEHSNSSIIRYLRPVMSELGEIDIAALFEWEKGKRYIYQIPYNSSCLVECDEEPPHSINDEALKIAIAITLSLGGNVVDEVYVMRKTVIDGSNTTGFQRTAIVGIGGSIKDDEGIVNIQTIALEEDAARKIEDKPNEIIYNLDRLGIPLIEISTAPDIKSPEQAERVAFKIGQLLRLTGKVKRGIGTIRQDLNISITGGTKIEIKGVQKLELIPLIVKNEALRQYNLLKIKDELYKRGLKEESVKQGFLVKELTEVIKDTNSKLIKNELRKGNSVIGIRVKGFNGIFGWEVSPNRRFGTEVADYVKALVGLGGILHSDELPGYGISKEEVDSIRKELQITEKDAFIILLSPKEKVQRALEVILERILQAFKGVPKETRAALEDGNTKFLRPQPGAARMYPETDIPPRRIDRLIIEGAKSLVPESPEVRLKRYLEMGLSSGLAKAILQNIRLDLFEELIRKYSPKVSPVVIANTIENTLKYVKSKGGDISYISDEVLEDVIRALYEDKITKDSIPEILLEVAMTKANINEILAKYVKISDEELLRIIKDELQNSMNEIKDKKDKAFSIVMGKVMNKVKGRVEGKKVAELIKKELETLI